MSAFLTGEELRAAVVTLPPPAPFLIDQFLAANCAMMLTGETGRGKSVIAGNMVLALSGASPLFSALSIPLARRVYYMQMEGSWAEQRRRLHFMQQAIPWNPHNLFWDAHRKTRLNLLDPHSATRKYDQIAAAFVHPPDLVVIDPIYKAGGDLAKAEPALALVNFSDRLMESLGCSVLLVHHPHRDRVTVYGKKIEEDDFYYGHSFLPKTVTRSRCG